MTANELDAVYTRLCTTMTALGESNAPLFLARFALLAGVRIGDGKAVARLIDAAAGGFDGGAVSRRSGRISSPPLWVFALAAVQRFNAHGSSLRLVAVGPGGREPGVAVTAVLDLAQHHAAFDPLGFGVLGRFFGRELEHRPADPARELVAITPAPVFDRLHAVLPGGERTIVSGLAPRVIPSVAGARLHGAGNASGI